MKKFLSKVSRLGKKAKFAIGSAIAVIPASCIGLICSATGDSSSEAPTVAEATETALEGVAADMMDMLVKVLPIVLGVVGAVLVITFGIKMFKKFTGR